MRKSSLVALVVTAEYYSRVNHSDWQASDRLGPGTGALDALVPEATQGEI